MVPLDSYDGAVIRHTKVCFRLLNVYDYGSHTHISYPIDLLRMHRKINICPLEHRCERNEIR
jgi:hypothetical protein